MAERSARVDGLIQDLEGRLKTVEEELNDEDPAEGADRVEESPMEKAGGFGTAVADDAEGANDSPTAVVRIDEGPDDGYVNIGDAKTLAAAVASEVRLSPREPEVSAQQ